MNKFIISVEATADLNAELLKKYDIRQVEMNFNVDDKEYSTDNIDMTHKIFFQKMRENSKVSTSQVNAYDAEKYFEELLKENKDIIHISFSSALSGTYNNVKNVAEELNKKNENKIYVVDSLTACTGQGLLAIIASIKSDEFETAKELADYIDSIKLNICHLFIVDNLKYLSRTGRISKLTAAIGSVLQIKPILHTDNNGCLTSIGKVISRKKSIVALAEKTAKLKNNISDLMFIANADCQEEAEILQNLIYEKINIKPEIVDLGYVIGCHSGPGTLAVFFTGSER